MRVIIQRVSQASVSVDKKICGQINHGFLILCGFEESDTIEDIDWLSQKIVNLRIFNDPDHKMNLSIQDVNGDILVVSQFTLHAATKKGNRPSFIQAAKPAIAIPLYENFKQRLKQLLGKEVACGIFGADMKVSLLNDGPVTLFIDSKNRE